MLSDPQSITISGTPVSLPRIAMGNQTGSFRSANGDLEVIVSHQANRRERSVIRLNRSKIGQDPLNASIQKSYSSSVSIVVDAPLNGVGFTDAELEADIKGLTALVNTAGFLAKFLGKEA